MARRSQCAAQQRHDGLAQNQAHGRMKSRWTEECVEQAKTGNRGAKPGAGNDGPGARSSALTHKTTCSNDGHHVLSKRYTRRPTG
jgi:hypothetical protein